MKATATKDGVPYMRRAEAARYLGVSTRTLSMYQRRKIVGCFKPSRRVTLFRREDLDAAMERFRFAAVGEDGR